MFLRNFIHCFLAVFLFFLAQAAGSNNASLSVILLCLTIFAMEIISRSFVERRDIRCKDVLSFVAVFVGLVAGLAVVILFIASSLPPMRVFNYQPVHSLFDYRDDVPVSDQTVGLSASSNVPGGSASQVLPSSVTARVEILRSHALNQLRVNPIFGDLRAERFEGGEGRYLHSLLSIQTHLGIVGSILFFGFYALRFSLVQVNGTQGSLGLAVVGTLFVVGVTSTFFTWVPIWFAVGALLAMPRKVSDKIKGGRW